MCENPDKCPTIHVQFILAYIPQNFTEFPCEQTLGTKRRLSSDPCSLEGCEHVTVDREDISFNSPSVPRHPSVPYPLTSTCYGSGLRGCWGCSRQQTAWPWALSSPQGSPHDKRDRSHGETDQQVSSDVVSAMYGTAQDLLKHLWLERVTFKKKS